MSTEATTEPRSLAVVIDEYGLDTDSARALIDSFDDVWDLADRWKAAAQTLSVTDESQTHIMAAARDLRLQIRNKRISIDNKRKELKEAGIRKGKAIEGVVNIILGVIVPIEKYLQEQENFVKMRREAEEVERRAKAEAALQLQEETEARERQEADDADRARVAAENAQLKADAEKREKAHAAELKRNQKAREKAEAAMQAEREAERVDREAQQADERAKREKAEAAERADRERQRKIDEAAHAKEIRIAQQAAEREAHKRDLAHREALRKANQVKCPSCGEVFESTKHRAEAE